MNPNKVKRQLFLPVTRFVASRLCSDDLMSEGDIMRFQTSVQEADWDKIRKNQ